MDAADVVSAAPKLESSERVARLEPPDRHVEIVLDTDANNEIDDQFALVYAYLAPSIDLEAVYAAPFHNSRSTGPADGMAQSLEEIHHLLERLDHPDPEADAYAGAKRYLTEIEHPESTRATEDLIERARDRPSEDPLYVVAIGAPTNVAAAIARAPEIVKNIVVVWLGGQPHHWHAATEFNLMQDPAASRVLFDSGVPLVQVPCKQVAEQLRTTIPEVRFHLRGKGPVAEYLADITEAYTDDPNAVWSSVIWDIATIGYLRNPDWTPSHLADSPILTDQLTYSHDRTRHAIRVVHDVNRDRVFGDLFDLITDTQPGQS